MIKMTQPQAAHAAQDEMDFSQSTILIVDDNAQNVELLQAYLEGLNCKLMTAGDGLACMKIIEQGVEAGGRQSPA